MSTVLVTGPTGFIGRALVERLLVRGHRVVCLIRDAEAAEPLRAAGAELRAGDVTQPETLKRVVSAVDTVYHLAGKVKAFRNAELDAVNRLGVTNVAQACAASATPPVLVAVSSLAAAGPSDTGRPRSECDRAMPVSAYGRSKRAGELAALALADQVPTTIVRPPAVFGPGDPNQLPLLRPILRYGVLFVPGMTGPRISVIHVDDLVEGLIMAAERGVRLGPGASESGEGIYQFAADETPYYVELGQMIADAAGRRVRIMRAPRRSAWLAAAGFEIGSRLVGRPSIMGFDKVREALAGDWVGSDQKARDELGYFPLRSLSERLRETVEWYREQGWL